VTTHEPLRLIALASCRLPGRGKSSYSRPGPPAAFTLISRRTGEMRGRLWGCWVSAPSGRWISIQSCGLHTRVPDPEADSPCPAPFAAVAGIAPPILGGHPLGRGNLCRRPMCLGCTPSSSKGQVEGGACLLGAEGLARRLRFKAGPVLRLKLDFTASGTGPPPRQASGLHQPHSQRPSSRAADRRPELQASSKAGIGLRAGCSPG